MNTNEKFELFEEYNKVIENPNEYSYFYRNYLYNAIVYFGWLEDYKNLYPDKFGL